MFRLPEKGTIDYLKKKKQLNLMVTAFSFLAVIIIYVTGLIIYKNNQSVYTVIAAVASLPAAKALVSYVMVVPHKELSKAQVDMVQRVVQKKEFHTLYNLIITSEEKAMLLSLVLVYEGHVMIYSESPKLNASELEAYIKKILTCKYSSIKVYKALPELLKRAEALNATQKPEQRPENANDAIICKRLTVYAL